LGDPKLALIELAGLSALAFQLPELRDLHAHAGEKSLDGPSIGHELTRLRSRFEMVREVIADRSVGHCMVLQIDACGVVVNEGPGGPEPMETMPRRARDRIREFPSLRSRAALRQSGCELRARPHVELAKYLA
jgi:hypothetical protein